MKKFILLLAFLLPLPAQAQLGPSTPGPMWWPNWYQGYVPTPYQWQVLLTNKLDYFPAGLPFAYGGCAATTAVQCLSNLGGFPTPTAQTANTVFAGPTSGVAAIPTWRALVGADLPVPSATTLGGVKSLVVVSHKWINTISTAGAPAATQPACADLSDSSTGCSAAAGITALTGPVTASGSGSVVATITSTISAAGPIGTGALIPVVTYNAAGQLTAVTTTTNTPAVSAITGAGTGVLMALAINVGTAGSPVVNGGALGTPLSGTATNLSGTAASLTAGNANNIAGGSPQLTNAAFTTCGSISTVANVITCGSTPGTGNANFGTATGNTVNHIVTMANTTVGVQDSGTLLSALAPLASPTFTGTVTIPTPFTIGAVSMTATGTQLNYLAAATGTTGTTSTNLVFSTSPTLVTPVLGVATGTSLALGGALVGGTVLTVAGTANISGSITAADLLMSGGNYIHFGTQSYISNIADGVLLYQSNVGSGVSVDVSTNVAKFRNVANNADSAITAGAATFSSVLTVNSTGTYSGGQRSPPATLTISTVTFTPSFDAAQNYSATLVHASCPCTMANPSTTPVAGQSGVFYIIQSSTGSDTIGTWGSLYKFAGGTPPTLSTAANAVDTLSYTVRDATHIQVGIFGLAFQ